MKQITKKEALLDAMCHYTVIIEGVRKMRSVRAILKFLRKQRCNHGVCFCFTAEQRCFQGYWDFIRYYLPKNYLSGYWFRPPWVSFNKEEILESLEYRQTVLAIELYSEI